MKPLTLLFFLFLSFKLFSQESDNPYKDRGKSLVVPYDYDTEEKRKEREGRKLIEELKPKDLSNQFAPEIEEYFINRVVNAGNEDLARETIRIEYALNAKNIFKEYAYHLFMFIISVGLFIVYFFRSYEGKTVFLLNVTWVLFCYLISLLLGNTVDDKLFILSSNISTVLGFSIPYLIVSISFYFLLKNINNISQAQRAVILAGFTMVILFGLGFFTGGYENEYFSNFEGHHINIVSTILSIILFAFVLFSKEKRKL